MSDFSPALTSDQWREYAPWDRTLAHFAPALAADNAHGAAALALHAQPYGFTWDDYDELIDTAHEIERDYGPPEHLLPEPKRQIATLRSLARRIATLHVPKGHAITANGGLTSERGNLTSAVCCPSARATSRPGSEATTPAVPSLTLLAGDDGQGIH